MKIEIKRNHPFKSSFRQLINKTKTWKDNLLSRVRQIDLPRWESIKNPFNRNKTKALSPAYQVDMNLPGLDEKDIQIELKNNALIIRGEKKNKTEKNYHGAYWVERSYASFHRVIPLPPNTDAKQIRAELKRGTLNISIPKTITVKSKPRHIEIKYA